MAESFTNPERDLPRIRSGRNGAGYYWQAGDSYITAYPGPPAWEARTRSRRWGRSVLVVDNHFRSDAEATNRCRRLADVLAEDRRDGDRGAIVGAPEWITYG
jgi:hypothetical protein